MRRRFVYDRSSGAVVEVGEQASANLARNNFTSDAIYDGLRASDGADISTRAKHRDYMKRNGLTTADDYTQKWSDDARARAAYFTEGKGGAVTRQDVERAVYELETGRKAQR